MKLTDLTPEQKRIAIAEACGWKQIQKLGLDNELYGWIEQGPLDPIPDYLNDLNAMHEAQKRLMLIEGAWHRFALILRDICTPEHGAKELCWPFAVEATAAQRADAFLLATGRAEL